MADEIPRLVTAESLARTHDGGNYDDAGAVVPSTARSTSTARTTPTRAAVGSRPTSRSPRVASGGGSPAPLPTRFGRSRSLANAGGSIARNYTPSFTPGDVRLEFATTYLANRAGRDDRGRLRFREERPDDYLESLAALLEDVAVPRSVSRVRRTDSRSPRRSERYR